MITVITIREPQTEVSIEEKVTIVEVTDASVIGAQGPKGDKGDSGESIKGDKGDKGDTGNQEIQSQKGDKGDDGADSTVLGPAGPQNLFIQADEPVYNAPFLWLKPLGNGKFDLRYGAGE